MRKAVIFLALSGLFSAYTFLVYTKGVATEHLSSMKETVQIKEGKKLFQQYNCIACHQVYGLGGYLGPDLTTAWSDRRRGEAYLRAMLRSGGARMPNFHFTPAQIEALLSYLRHVDTTATTQSSKLRGK
jgi:nitric oxide reductase subunit C